MVTPCASAQMLTCGNEWQWMCNNGECIAQYDLCNGIEQCTDGSDEIDCDKRQWQNKYINVPREEQMKSAIQTGMDEINPTNSTTTSRSMEFNGWLIALTSVLVIILLIVIVLRCRQRRNSLVRNNRAYGVRKSLNMGQNNGDDEDDLLIGSLYS